MFYIELINTFQNKSHYLIFFPCFAVFSSTFISVSANFLSQSLTKTSNFPKLNFLFKLYSFIFSLLFTLYSFYSSKFPFLSYFLDLRHTIHNTDHFHDQTTKTKSQPQNRYRIFYFNPLLHL